MATDAQTLLAESDCLACYGFSLAQRIRLALLVRQLLANDPSADVTPATLLSEANCFRCFTGTSLYDLIEMVLLDKISLASGIWVRPGDWLALPVLVPGDQKFVGLFAVTNDNSNYLALSAAGNYSVDWGDGVVDLVASGVQANHLYTYAAIPASTLSSRGYKQVIVTVTPQAGQQLTNLNLQRKHTAVGLPNYNSAWLDISINSPNLSSLTIRQGAVIRIVSLEQATLGQIGSVSSFSGLFADCWALQSALIADSSGVTNFSSMFSGCISLTSVRLFDTSSGTSFTSMFAFCYTLKSLPLFNTSSVTTFDFMFDNCFLLKSVPLFDTSLGKNFAAMFVANFQLETVPFFNTSSGTNFGNMFGNCSALSSVPALNVSLASSVFGLIFNGCNSLASAPLIGGTISIIYTNTKLSTQAIIDIFNALGIAAGAQTIDCTSTPGYAGLTPGDKAIATGKGWTVT